jgi:hypothetical protein
MKLLDSAWNEKFVDGDISFVEKSVFPLPILRLG